MSLARERFRRILAESACTPAAPIFDPLSARIAELQGWKVGKLSGSVAKFANLAVPDGVPISNMSDLVDVCWRIHRVSDICLIVDADDGGGGALAVMRTVQELERAGVSAIEIEDNRVPERLSDDDSRHAQLISKEEHVGRLRAAVAARRDPSTVIVARTSALAELPLELALDRIEAYARTGAEAINLLPGKLGQRRADLEAVRRVTKLPLCLRCPPESGKDYVDPADSAFLVAHGVRIGYLGANAVYAMAVKAIYDGLAHFKEGRPAPELKERQAGAELLRAVDRTAEFKRWETEYLKD